MNLLIGCGENKNALLAAELLNRDENFNIELAKSDEELIQGLKSEKFDAIIRGSLKSFNILKNLKELNMNATNSLTDLNSSNDSNSLNGSNNLNNLNGLNDLNETDKSDEKINKPIYRASYIKANTSENQEFLLGPVGIDEGDSIDEKLNLAIYAAEFMNKIDKVPKIAILADGRKEDLGRSSTIDKSIEESEELVEKIENSLLNLEFLSDFSVKNYYILIEKAVKEGNNIIIAPDGIIGNIIFRSLVLLSSWESYGAIALGMDKIFIDTSRDQTKEGYIRALKFAQSLVNKSL
ncbi:methanogenesis marker protein Mmp4/MtxX [Methanobrevibacter sp. TMH8]|uniref:methanogenesis marker protein Mmp4/MtxX n=1 Tax=Methanobrevibacter sp. TMH8 TaxID=2848611 RepID=UPI001CCD459C